MFCEFNFCNGLQDYNLISRGNLICNPVWPNGILPCEASDQLTCGKSLKKKFSSGIFLGHEGPRRRDIQDKSSMQGAFFVVLDTAWPGCAAIWVGTSRYLGLHTWLSEKLYARVHAIQGVVRQHGVLRRVLRRFWEGFWRRVLRRVLRSGLSMVFLQ